MRLVLKVDVETLRGTLEGVPRLAEMLKRHGARATFLFNLGPDRSGRAIPPHLFAGVPGERPGRLAIARTYGWRSVLHGTLLPGPDLGRAGAAVMRAVRDAGFEVGVQGWDRAGWEHGIANADAAWTSAAMHRAVDRFVQVFGEPPRVHGAAGWKGNLYALRLTQRLGFTHCSDTRGTHPFVPVYNGEVIRCAQYPTTLPTIDELLVTGGATPDTVAEALLARTRERPRPGQVFTLRAELEGLRFAPEFDRLLAGWTARGYRLVALRDAADTLRMGEIPKHEITEGSVPGRPATLLTQGGEFPGTLA
jgi:peptidoglycan/xylan/chitin deacetylase (PgdA/CDA1 family)